MVVAWARLRDHLTTITTFLRGAGARADQGTAAQSRRFVIPVGRSLHSATTVPKLWHQLSPPLPRRCLRARHVLRTRLPFLVRLGASSHHQGSRLRQCRSCRCRPPQAVRRRLLPRERCTPRLKRRIQPRSSMLIPCSRLALPGVILPSLRGLPWPSSQTGSHGSRPSPHLAEAVGHCRRATRSLSCPQHVYSRSLNGARGLPRWLHRCSCRHLSARSRQPLRPSIALQSRRQLVASRRYACRHRRRRWPSHVGLRRHHKIWCRSSMAIRRNCPDGGVPFLPTLTTSIPTATTRWLLPRLQGVAGLRCRRSS